MKWNEMKRKLATDKSLENGQKSGITTSRRLIKKIRPLLYSKYPPSKSKYGLIIDIGHREGCHSELYFQNYVGNLHQKLGRSLENDFPGV